MHKLVQVATVSLLFLACLTAPGMASMPPVLGFRIGTLEYIDEEDLFRAPSRIHTEITLLTYRHLVRWDGEKPRVDLATWSKSEDGLTWTFSLSEEATWHDGNPVTAGDVAFTLEKFQREGLEPFYSCLQGLKAVEIIDLRSVALSFEREPEWVPGLGIPILPAGSQDDRDSGSLPVGSGPLRVIQWVPGDFVYLEPFDDSGPDYVAFIRFDSAEEMLEALLSGEIHLALDLSPDTIESLEVEGMKVTGGEVLDEPWIPAGYTQVYLTEYLQGFQERPGGVVLNGTLDTYFNVKTASPADIAASPSMMMGTRSGRLITWIVLAVVVLGVTLVIARRDRGQKGDG